MFNVKLQLVSNATMSGITMSAAAREPKGRAEWKTKIDKGETR